MRPEFSSIKYFLCVLFICVFIYYCTAGNDAINLYGENESNLNGSSTEKPISRLVTYLNNRLFKIIDEKQNLIFSPFSISLVLVLLYSGASSNTAKIMENALQYNNLNLQNPSKDVQEIFKSTMKSLLSVANTNELKLANGIYLQNGIEINPHFTANIELGYNGTVQLVDFRNSEKETQSTINNYVSNATNKHITNFLTKPLEPTTVMLLISAIYFKGNWEKPFNKFLTKDRNFYGLKNEVKKVPFMEFKETVLFFHDASVNYSFLSLNYKGNDTCMIFALPDDKNQIPDLEIITLLLHKVTDSFKEVKVHAFVPKFSLEYERILRNDFVKFGLGDVFSSKANFANIRAENDISPNDMIHKAKIDIDEIGSEASAASGISFEPRMGGMIYTIFQADHPFIFFMFHKATGVILFFGRIVDI